MLQREYESFGKSSIKQRVNKESSKSNEEGRCRVSGDQWAVGDVASSFAGCHCRSPSNAE